MARSPKFKVEDVATALRSAGGIYRGAATLLECAPNTIKNYVARHKSLQSLVSELADEQLDMAETELLAKVRQGNLTAITFYLKTKGRKRGYSQRLQASAKAAEAQALDRAAKRPDLSKLSTEELEELEALLDKAAADKGRRGPGEGAA